MDIVSRSPLPNLPIKNISKQTVDFFVAFKALADGKRITRDEWENDDIYGSLEKINEKDEMKTVQLHKSDGKFYVWHISDGDLVATDWSIL